MKKGLHAHVQGGGWRGAFGLTLAHCGEVQGSADGRWQSRTLALVLFLAPVNLIPDVPGHVAGQRCVQPQLLDHV